MSGRILVLGAGFIGTAVGQALLAADHHVEVLTRSPLDDVRRARLDGARVRVGDAGDVAVLDDALARVDQVVWVVGSSSPAECEQHPASDLMTQVAPVLQLLELMRRRPGARLTFVSSGGTVYGETTRLPITEDAPLRPVSAYGIVKVACEHYVSMYRRTHQVPASIVRVANAYGPGQRPVRQQGLIAHLLRSACVGEPPRLFGSPDAVRDYVYIDDVAAAVAAVALDPQAPAAVNVGSGTGHAVHEVVTMVEAITGTELTALPKPSRPCDVDANVLDISRLRGFLDFDPVDLPTGIERTWKAFLDGEGLIAALRGGAGRP